ncbi:MAG: CDP-alcohol phosphatidyltransferase family protein [Dehalococcoidia bacterium]
MSRPKSFTLLPHSVPRRITEPIVSVLARAGVSPNHLTLLGFLGNVGAGVLAARGEFLAAGALVLVFSALDLLDGALARSTGQASPFGAIFDSVLDRLSEAAVLGGLVFYYGERNQQEEVILCFVALAGSIMVSYVRAKAQVEGFDLREGLFTRAERVLLMGGGLIIGQVRIALWILAVMASATALQRVYSAWRHFQTATPDGAVPEEKPS